MTVSHRPRFSVDDFWLAVEQEPRDCTWYLVTTNKHASDLDQSGRGRTADTVRWSLCRKTTVNVNTPATIKSNSLIGRLCFTFPDARNRWIMTNKNTVGVRGPRGWSIEMSMTHHVSSDAGISRLTDETDDDQELKLTQTESLLPIDHPSTAGSLRSSVNPQRTDQQHLDHNDYKDCPYCVNQVLQQHAWTTATRWPSTVTVLRQQAAKPSSQEPGVGAFTHMTTKDNISVWGMTKNTNRCSSSLSPSRGHSGAARCYGTSISSALLAEHRVTPYSQSTHDAALDATGC